MSGGDGPSGFERDLRGPADVDGNGMLTLGEAEERPWRRPPRDSRSPRRALVSPGVEAAVAAVTGVLVLPGLGRLQRQVLVRSDLDGGFFVVGVVLSAVVAWAAAAGAHRWLGGGRRRDAAVVGIVAALLAGTAWGGVVMGGGWRLWDYLPPRPVLVVVSLAGVVLAVRTRATVARLGAGFSAVATGLAALSALVTGWPLLTAYLPTAAPPAAASPPADLIAEATPSVPAPAPPPAPASPTLGDLCHPDELEATASTPEPGGNDVATTLTATNVGSRECVVEGWPTLHLYSGGEDLALVVHPRESPPTGEHVDAVPVELTPGASAQTQVWWPSWGAAADLDAAQQLQVGVGGGIEVVNLAPGDRWDVVRSAEAYVAPWHAAP